MYVKYSVVDEEAGFCKDCCSAAEIKIYLLSPYVVFRLNLAAELLITPNKVGERRVPLR
jgi:hypothetical protein